MTTTTTIAAAETADAEPNAKAEASSAARGGMPLRTIASEVAGDGVVKPHVRTKVWRAKRSASVLVARSLGSAVVMSVACGATMLLASQLRSGSPWGGLNAMATAVGLGPKRAKKRFDGATTLAGAGVLTAGFVVFAGLYEGALAATGRRRSLTTGFLAALAGFAVDELALKRKLVPSFRRTLGTGGTLAKYAALGLAAAR